MNPYFSICIPTTNRGKTIYETLCSVANQSFRDFELIIVDCGSSDNTRSEIERFFNSSVFNNSRFVFKYETRDYVPITVEDWNEPLRLARGKYIAMLEGDDQYLPNHLLDAYDYLNTHDNIGLYAVGNQYHNREQKGRFSSKNWLDMTIMITDITPPSESIFIRLNNGNEPFLYNDVDYEYAPEIDLYARLALAGFDVYFSEKTDVIRDRSNKNWYNDTWHFYVDRFTFLEKYKNDVADDRWKLSLYRNSEDCIMISVASKSISNMAAIARRIVDHTSYIMYIRLLVKVFVRIMLLKFHVLRNALLDHK